jgi:hypothetical protein
MMTLDDLRAKNLIVFECLSGSRAYGLATETSDTDIKGVFIAPPDVFLKFDPPEQIHSESHDIVYYELKKFLFLIARNNPNALEMIFTPSEHVRIELSDFAPIRKYDFLSKMCQETFANYALGQVKKAKGLNKKIVNPMPEERLGILDFCFIADGAGSIKVEEWLSRQSHNQAQCGLAKVPNFRDTYALFINEVKSFSGLVRSLESTDLCLSSIPKGLVPLAYLHFNRDAFKAHCEQHREYWEWVNKRNPDRYATNMAHGKNYDSKNMMHVFRLLAIARMIAEDKTIDFRQFDREFLLKIKAGDYEYDDLVARAEGLVRELDNLYAKSDLKPAPEIQDVERLHMKIRLKFYLDRGWHLPPPCTNS